MFHYFMMSFQSLLSCQRIETAGSNKISYMPQEVLVHFALKLQVEMSEIIF